MKRTKELVSRIIIAAVFTTMAAGCGSRRNTVRLAGEDTVAAGQTVNSDKNAVTDKNTVMERDAVTEENAVTEVKERGLAFKISHEFTEKGVELDHYNENVKGYRMITISYYSPTYRKLLDEVLDMEPEERTPERTDQYTQEMQAVSRTLMELVMVETDTYEKLTATGKVPEDFTYNAPAEWFGTNGAYTYIISIPELDNGKLNEAEQKEYQKCKAYMQTVKENLSFIPVELESNVTVIGTSIPSFQTEDLYGTIVTDDIFAQKKLTVVNVWGTFCGPCVEEMPELALWAGELPDDVQIIGLVGDIEGKEDVKHLELARTIVEKAGADFVTVIANDDFQDMMDGIIGYPTTFFVDREGNGVGDPIVGADVDAYKTFVEGYFVE